MPLVASGWSELFIPVIYKFHEVGRNLRQPVAPRLYNVQSSALSKEEHLGIGGVSPDAWDNFKNSGQVSEVDFNKGYGKTFTHVDYPVRFRLPQNLVRDDQYGVIQSMARRVGISSFQKNEKDGASVFNNAFTAGAYAGPDGKALCASDHPASPDNTSSGGQQSNTGTYALTAANLSTVRAEMMSFTDDVGSPLGIMPDTLLVHPDLEDTAIEAVRSAQDPDSGNNAINPQNGRYQIIPWASLTDSNNWFMMDSIWMRESLWWYWREMFYFMLIQETTTYALFEAKMAYSFGFDDWRWVYGNNVS